LWKKQLVSNPQGKFDFAPLDRWRPFQAQVPLRDQCPKDSGLEVIAGIHLFCEQYYAFSVDPSEGLNIPPRYYNCKLIRDINSDIISLFTYVKRIPDEWDETNLIKLPTQEEIKKMSRPVIAKWLDILYQELNTEDPKSAFPQAGDYIIWDMRLAHQNGNQNLSGHVRQTFYHTYVPSGDINLSTIEGIKSARNSGRHPPDFPKSHATIEHTVFTPDPLSDLGQLLYSETNWGPDTVVTENQPTIQLTAKQIAFIRRYGFVVIPECIPRPLINSLISEIDESLEKIAGIDTQNLLESTSEQWGKVCGTFGGMLEFYLLRGQDNIRSHPNPYWVMAQILENTWFAENRTEIGYGHPFETLNPRHLWLYVDRMNYRLPEEIMEKISSKSIEW